MIFRKQHIPKYFSALIPQQFENANNFNLLKEQYIIHFIHFYIVKHLHVSS